MIEQTADFDMKFTPEFAGQVADEEVAEASPEEGQEVEVDDDDDYDDSEEDDELEETEGAEGIEEEEYVPKKQYDELRKFATQKAMALAELKRAPQQAEIPARQSQPISSDNPLDDIIADRVAQAMEKYLEPVRQQEADYELQSRIMAIADADPDFGSVSPQFLENLADNPALFDIEGGVELAYKAAKSDFLGRVSSARIKAETKAAVERRELKSQLSEGNVQNRARQGEKVTSPEDAIRASILGAGTPKPF
jgi:hypothetical protein